MRGCMIMADYERQKSDRVKYVSPQHLSHRLARLESFTHSYISASLPSSLFAPRRLARQGSFYTE
jgi:hypothetical protein